MYTEQNYWKPHIAQSAFARSPEYPAHPPAKISRSFSEVPVEPESLSDPGPPHEFMFGPKARPRSILTTPRRLRSLISVELFFGYVLWLKRYFKIPPTVPSDARLAPLG